MGEVYRRDRIFGNVWCVSVACVVGNLRCVYLREAMTLEVEKVSVRQGREIKRRGGSTEGKMER